ncbi:hypothetical protein CIK05_09535 [Bdellovibrio sp. qaytius]|nr:hypothetical protein CIK05_09535 [Bdellovibrio sp. qaytius]
MSKTARKRLRYIILSILPKFISYWWIRQSLDLAFPKSNSKLTFEIASNAHDLLAALKLVQQNFEREGYAEKNSNGLRLTPYHLLPETVVIVAKRDNQVLATISVVPRTRFGLPLESSFTLNSLLDGKGRVIEVSALAVDPKVRGQQGEILYNLLKYMYHCNVGVLQANTEVIGVNPKMVPLYEAILLFNKIPKLSITKYDFANGAPVVPMMFSFDNADASYEKTYAKKPSKLNMFEFFKLPPPPQFILPNAKELDRYLPQRQPSEFIQILSMAKEAIATLTLEQKKVIKDLYSPWPISQRLIGEALHV